MAITDTLGQSINNSNNVNSYAALAFTPAANDIIIVAAGITDTAASLGITDSQGITYTKLVDQAQGIQKVGLFLANTLAANSTDTIAVTCTGDNGTGCVGFLRRIGGGRTTLPFHRQVSFATGGAGTTPTVVMPAAIRTANGFYGFVFNLSNPAGVTPPSEFTEQQDIGHTTPDMGGEWGRALSGVTSTTITWGSTSATAWLAVGVEIYVSTEAPNIPRIVHHRNQLAA